MPVKQTVCVVIGWIALLSSSSCARQSVILDDVFNNNLNNIIWDDKSTLPCYALTANGILQLHGANRVSAKICSKPTLWVKPEAGETVRVIFANVSAQGGSNNIKLAIGEFWYYDRLSESGCAHFFYARPSNRFL